MSYYTGLARVARKTGYPVVEVSGWKTRGHGPMRGCKTIMAHHTATSRHANGDYPSLRVVRDGHGSLPGPLSHYGLGRDGTIYVIAAGLCYHTGKTRSNDESNSYSIGIEAENDGLGEPWSAAQLDAYVKLCKALCDEFKLPVSRVVGHKEAAVPAGRKVDPALPFSMNEFRRRIAAMDLNGEPEKAPESASQGSTPTAPKPPAPKPSKKRPVSPSKGKWPAAYITVVKKHNKYSHAAWRELMKRVGLKDRTFTVEAQRWLKSLGYYKGLIDNDFGRMTATAMQRFLKDCNFYKGRIDGIRGPMTIQAECRYLNHQAEVILNS